jgi:ABC-type Mn2+/Zn2+ transport system ATPase subunit
MKTDPQPLIRFENLNLGYGRRTVLRGVQGSIPRGVFMGIVGPNGSGKTTLLKAILGRVKPQSGQIIRNPQLRFGYVPQRNTIDALYPLTSLDIVLMGLYGTRMPGMPMTNRDRDTALDAIRSVGLEVKAQALFSELSGGQQQRILLARALVGQPDILILDEPTNGMDIVSEASVMKTVDDVHSRTGMTIVLVTHLLHVVAQHVTEIGLIQGDRIEFGATQTLLTAQHLTELYGTPIQVGQINGKTVVTTL